MKAELITDAWHRSVMYRNCDYSRDIFPGQEQKEAIETGKNFVANAHPEVWAKNAGLVQRIRDFLRANFHWHDRLVKSGSDLDVVKTLVDMVP